MKNHASAHNANRQTERAAQHDRATGGKAISIAPPTYGIEFVDRGLAAAPMSSRVQTKLTVAAPGDAHEQEADHVADKVMSTDTIVASGAPPPQQQVAPRMPRLDNETLEAAPPALRVVLTSPGSPMDPATQARMELAIGTTRSGALVDFSSVRIHTDSAAATSARHLGARAYAVGPHVAFARGQFAPGTGHGDHLIAHELAHVLQQGASGASIARSVDDWLSGSLDVGSFSYTKLLGEIDELNQWLQRQITSSEDTIRIENTLAVLRREAARREKQTQRPRGSQRRRGSQRTSADQAERPTRRPRILLERTSVAYADPAEMRAEFDLIMEWLARGDLPAAERAILRMERDNLAPQLQQDRVRVVATRGAARLQTALTPTERDEASALEYAARAIRGIQADASNPQLFYLYHNNERIPISREQAAMLHSQLPTQLQRACRLIEGRVEYDWGRYQAQVELNEDTFLIDDIAGLLGGVKDPGKELGRRRQRALVDLQRLQAMTLAGSYVEAAAILPALERDSQVIGALARAFYEASSLRGMPRSPLREASLRSSRHPWWPAWRRGRD